MDVPRSSSPPDRVDETEGTNPAGPQGRKVSAADIQHVQNLIESCLQLYMSQQEVVATLQTQSKIEPNFTRLVWVKLEEQNPVFFEAYQLRLKIKDQIVMFNYLLGQQQQALQKLQASWLMHTTPSILPATRMLAQSTLPMSAMLPMSAAAVPASAGFGKQAVWPLGVMPPVFPQPPQQQQQQQQQQQGQQQLPIPQERQGGPEQPAGSAAGMPTGATHAAMHQLTMQLQHQLFGVGGQPLQPINTRAPSPCPDFLASGESSPSASAGSLPPGLTPMPPPYYANNQQQPPALPHPREQLGLAVGAALGGGSLAASPGFPKPFSFNDLHGLMPAMDDAVPHDMDYDSDNGGGIGQQMSGVPDGEGDMLMGGALLQPTFSF